MHRARLLFGSWLVLLLGMGRAEAGETALQLLWSAPPGCPNQQDVLRRVHQLAADRGAAPLPLQAVGRVWRTGDGTWHVELQTRMSGLSGERRLEGADCEEVSDAAALVLALLIDADQNPPPQAPSATTEPAPTPPQEASRPVPARSASKRQSTELRIAALLGSGKLPSLAAGAELQGGWVVLPLFSAELRLSGWLPQTRRSPARPDVGGRFWVLEGGSALCLRPRVARARFDSCGGFALSHIRARGIGAFQATNGQATWGAFTMEQAVAFRIVDAMGLRAALATSWAPSRPRFSIEDVGEIHRPAAFELRGSLGLEFAF